MVIEYAATTSIALVIFLVLAIDLVRRKISLVLAIII